MSLSTKAHQLYRYLEERLLGNRAAPNYDEMRTAIKLKSKSDIKRYLSELRDAKLIDYEDGKPRSIVLLNIISRFVRIPIGGSISAGSPIDFINRMDTAIEYDHDCLYFHPDQLPKTDDGALVAFRVDGDSMIDANIQDGDWVILLTKFEKRIGDMLAFYLYDDQSLTLKHYDERGDQIVLRPANTNYKPIIKPREQVEALGKVVLVHRRYVA
jgi:repressor LexA